MALQFKSNVYLEMDEIKSFLKIKKEITEFDAQLVLLGNMACARVESMINAPVLVQEKIETQDGTSSNNLVPQYWPVRSVNEIRIDYNSQFGAKDPTTIQDPQFYKTRGFYRDVKFGLAGSDVVIINDGQRAVIGQMLFGSIIQSVRIKYDAGWAYDKADVPDDLKYATLLLVEYFYMLRENRDLNVKQKGTMGGQMYMRDTGIPEEIEDLLSPYVNHTFGSANRPQRNSFSV